MFDQFTVKQLDLMSNIVKQAALYGITKSADSVRKSCVQLLAAILPYKAAFFDSKNIMEFDMFHFLVSLCLSMPNLYDQPKLSSVAMGGINDSNVFRLVLQAHCVQILITKIKLKTFYDSTKQSNSTTIDNDDYVSFEPTTPSENQLENEQKIYEFYKYIIALAEEKEIITFKDTNEKNEAMQTPKIISDTLKHSLMPFLRCSSLFFSNLTSITPTDIINNDSGMIS